MNPKFDLHFHKEDGGKWFIVLPEWKLAHAHLQMVSGADDLLFELAINHEDLYCTATFDEPEGEHITLTRIPGSPYGEDYEIEGAYTPLLWLCPVTKFVFGTYPDKIYISNIKTEN